jgi:hypothetical protein
MASNEAWSRVRDALGDAKGIAWDGCHKIYVLMDDEQMAQMADIGYDPLLPVPEDTASEALDILCDWYEQSCGLRFISAVRTVTGDPNEGFTNLIGQFEDDEEEED